MSELTIVMLVVAVCLATEAFFSGAEMAILASDKLRMRRRADEGHLGARLLMRMLEHPQGLFGVTLVGTNVAVITGTTVVTLALVDAWGAQGDAYTALIMSPLVLLFGELVPKTLARSRADALAPRVVHAVWFFSKLFAPVVFLLVKVTDAFLRLGKVDASAQKALVTREEIQMILREEPGTGALPTAERLMISRIFELAQKPVSEVMIPLSDVCAISAGASVDAAAALVAEKGFSRLPVYEQRIDDIRGVLHSFDLLFARPDATLTTLMRPTLFVPEQKLVDELLEEMRLRGHGMAVVVDEYGGAIGVVTVEDLLEEIVGEIEDEHDPRRLGFRRLGPERFALSGRVSVDELRNLFGIALPDGDYQTVAGYVLHRLRRLPAEGEKLRVTGGTLTVARVSDRAILELQLELDTRRVKPRSPRS